MERTDIATPLGPIALWAQAGALTSAKPLVLVITGAWAEADDMIRMPRAVAPDWDAAIMRLPGNGVPWLSETSIPAWAAATDAMIGTALKGRIVLAIGLSVGALVALALRAPEVRRIVALEPPLVMSKLWPIMARLHRRWPDFPAERPFLESVFGVMGEGRSEERTWFHLFEGAAPVEAILGGLPLMPPREVARFPSFVDEPERMWLARRPGVRSHVFAGVGHNIHVFAPYALMHVIGLAQAAALAES